MRSMTFFHGAQVVISDQPKDFPIQIDSSIPSDLPQVLIEPGKDGVVYGLIPFTWIGREVYTNFLELSNDGLAKVMQENKMNSMYRYPFDLAAIDGLSLKDPEAYSATELSSLRLISGEPFSLPDCYGLAAILQKAQHFETVVISPGPALSLSTISYTGFFGKTVNIGTLAGPIREAKFTGYTNLAYK